MSRRLGNDTKKLLPALHSICVLAGSNFPGETDLIISCKGNNSNGSLVVPHYVLLDLLEQIADQLCATKA